MIFALTAYATGTELGSPSVVYDRLVNAAALHPVEVSTHTQYPTLFPPHLIYPQFLHVKNIALDNTRNMTTSSCFLGYF